MRRISKIIVAFGIVVLMSIFFDMKVSSAATEGKFPTPPKEETLSLDINEGLGGIQINPVNTLANSYFLSGKSFISATGNKVTVDGETRSNAKVDRVAVNLYLQRWDTTRGVWVTVTSIGGFTEYNASMVKGGNKVNVESGYYYRTLAHHRVIHNVKVEQAYSNTSSIYVK